MHRGVVRSVAILGCMAWLARTLGCEHARTNSAFVDSDGDGLSDADESTVYGTSPLVADTDGDGMSDFDEIVLHGFNPARAALRFNPRVADLPTMEVRIVSPPLLTLLLTTIDGETWTYTTSYTIQHGASWSATLTESDSFTETVGVSDTLTNQTSFTFTQVPPTDAGAADAGAADPEGKAPPDAGGKMPPAAVVSGPIVVTLTNGLSSTVNRASTASVTLSFSATQAREIGEALTRAESYTESHTISASGGFLEVLVEIYNRGPVPFRVTNLVLSASLVNGDGQTVPVGNLDIDTTFVVFVPYAIAPGTVLGPVNYSRNFLTLDQIDELFRNAEGLQLQVGVYELSDAAGKPYVFDVHAIAARTATIAIDYGDQLPPERFLVATNLVPGRPGVRVEQALADILRMPFASDAEQGLTSVRNVSADAGGQWTVELRHKDEEGMDVTTEYVAPYDFRGIVLNAGDALRLTWSAP